MKQRNQFNIAKEAMQNKKAESVKTEQSVKTNFSEALNLLRWKNSKLMKVAYISKDHACKLADFFYFSTERSTQIRDRQQICFFAVIQI